MAFLLRFWRGQFPLGHMFWLGWFLPVAGGVVCILSEAAWIAQWLGGPVLDVFCGGVLVYSLMALPPLFRSAVGSVCRPLYKWAIHAFAILAIAFEVAAFAAVWVAQNRA
jgi:hypothetical protein